VALRAGGGGEFECSGFQVRASSIGISGIDRIDTNRLGKSKKRREETA